MHGPDEGGTIAAAPAEATASGIVLTTADFNTRVRKLIESRLDGHTPALSPLLIALIDDSINTSVAHVMNGEVRRFESEAEITALVEETSAKVAEAMRKQMNVYADIALTGFETADVIHDPADERYGKVKNGALIKLAIRANRLGNFELEIKFREILRRRKDASPKERLLNLYHLQDAYHSLGNSAACIDINKELIAYVSELRETRTNEEPLKLDYTVDFMEFRAHDTVFSARRDLGEDCEAEAIAYYDRSSDESNDRAVLDVALRRLRVIFDDKGDFGKALSYALRLSKVQRTDNRYDEHRKTERHIVRYLADLQIDFRAFGANAEHDRGKLSKLDARALKHLAGMAGIQSRLTAECAILEILLERELTANQRISTFCDLDQCYGFISAAEKKLALLDRYRTYLDSLTSDDLSPGQNLASLKFRANDSRYRTQMKFKDALGEAGQFDPNEMRNFYENHLVSKDADDTDKVSCFEALCVFYEEAEDHARAWDCAVQILDLQAPYTVKVFAGDAERRNGNRLGNDQRLASRGLTVRTVNERKAREEQVRAEEQRRRDEEEATRLSLEAKRKLLEFLEDLHSQAKGWRRGGMFSDMHFVPHARKDEFLSRLDSLVDAVKDPNISGLVQFIRQNLNAGNAFVKLGVLATAIARLKKLV